MSTHNIGFYEEISKISLNYQIRTLFLLLIVSVVTNLLTFISKFHSTLYFTVAYLSTFCEDKLFIC